VFDLMEGRVDITLTGIEKRIGSAGRCAMLSVGTHFFVLVLPLLACMHGFQILRI
jgi:hypothetical protein